MQLGGYVALVYECMIRVETKKQYNQKDSPVNAAEPVSVTVWDDSGGGPAVVFTHGIFTWATDSEYGFAAQRPLAQWYRLLMMDRRGYGSSPAVERSDYTVDAEDIVDVLGSTGAHVVGHANGALAALIAAAQCPQLVHSLALIQPPAFRAATEQPVVQRLLDRVEQAAVPAGMSVTEFLRASTEGVGMPMPEPTANRLRAVDTSMHERPVWEAEIPVAALRSAAWPKLVISGTWQDAPALYREYVGEPLMACADALATGIEATHLRVPGYYPHTQQSKRVNTALAQLWNSTAHRATGHPCVLE